MKRTLLILLTVVGIAVCGRSQSVPCYFDSLQLFDTIASQRAYKIRQSVINAYPPNISFKKINSKRSNTPLAKYIVPIVVHVVYSSTNSLTNIPDTQIEHQISILNQAMQDSGLGIQFCFAKKKPDGTPFSGIMRYNTGNSIRAYSVPGGFGQLMNTYQFDSEKYLNIYVVPGIFNANNVRTDILGIGIPADMNPFLPGIVMSYDFFGSFEDCYSCNLDSTSDGKIMVHETGHFFGLYHTFEGGCLGGNTDSTCNKKGDLCCDTRPENGPHWLCGVDVNTCNEMNDANDNQTNYMSYRECWSEFTPDQKQLMNATIQNSYYELTEAYNVLGTGANGCGYHTALFSVDRQTVCDTGTFVFTALDSGRQSYQWKVVNELGNTEYYDPNGSRSMSWKALSTGLYTIILTTIEGSEAITYTRTGFIRVLDCKTKIQSSNGNWYFGVYAGMNFSSTSPVIDDQARRGANDGPTINTTSSSISQSSTDGRILFYGGKTAQNKYQLFNKQHNKLKNGDSAWIHKASETGLLCIPRPGPNNGKHFYIVSACGSYLNGFPSNKYNGLYYSILDTTLDGGNGGIDLSNRNKPILPPTAYSQCHYPGNSALWSNEALIAIPKCGALKEYWLIVQGIDSTGWAIDSKFFIYNVQSGGIFFDHMDSCMAASYSINYSIASPDGRWIVNGGVLFTFDRYNGRLTQQRVLRTGDYGEPCVFSPDSKVLYYWDDAKSQLKQVDLTIASRPENIINISNRPFRTMQMGPDNKIYIGNFGTNYLSVIHYPNNINSTISPNACGFENKGFYTKQNGKGGLYQAGLPIVIHAKPQTELTGEIIAVRTACKTLKLTTNLCCDDNFQWDYGDASTGSGLDVTHTYANKGTYIITLTSNYFGTTRVLKDTIKIGIDTSVYGIEGSLLICDTTQKANYYNPKFNSNIQYRWSVSNGTMSGANGLNTMDVLWNGNGIKKITLRATSYEGCVDSTSKTVSSKPQVLNNLLSMKNKYCGTDTIFGTSPTGGNGKYKYLWRTRRAGTQSWLEMGKGDTLPFLIPQNTSQAMEFRRIVYSNDNGSGHGCFYQSNVIKITPFSDLNTISNNSSLCGIISSGSNLDSIPGINYQWQRSSDGTTWSDVSGQTGKHINSGTSLGSFYYYRRKAYTGSCVNYSNVVFAGGNKVKKQPTIITTCVNLLSSMKFSFELENENDTSLSFKWEYKLPSNSSYFGLSAETERELLGSTAYSYSNLPGTYFRCKITTACGTIWTTGAPIRITNSLDTILSQPNKNNTLSQGNNLNLICRITRDSLQNYQWQSSHNFGLDWFDMRGRKDDTLRLTKVNYCQNNKTYRLKITNKCGNVYYSDTANVKVSGLSSITQDYWMKDQWLDTGLEKNTRPERVVLSPDLFVANEILTSKPNPLAYKPNYNDPENYIHAMVRNRGIDSAKGGKLFLYWTLGAAGEKWPLNWTDVKYQNYHYNPDSAANSDLGFYPMGGPINTVPIELPDIGKGDSLILHYLWKNVPNPDWYYPITPRGRINGKEVNICVLGRIETCEESTFGMKFPEVLSTHANAANNNNIATRNLWVVYLFPEPPNGGNGSDTGTDIYTDTETNGYGQFTQAFKTHIGNRPLVEGGLTWVRSMSDTPMYRDICMSLSSSSFLSKADAYIHLNDKLLAAWIEGGSVSTGFQRIGDNVFRVTSTNPCLQNIVTDADFTDGFITYFAYKNIDNRFDNNQKFSLSIDQYDDGSLLEGSVVFELRDNIVIPPTIVESEVTLTACNWDGSGGTASYTIPYPSYTHAVYDNGAHSFLSVSGTGRYNLPEGDYTVNVYDNPYNTIYRISVNVYSSSPTTYNIIDTAWYDCDDPDSAYYTAPCNGGTMYNFSNQVVSPRSGNFYALSTANGPYSYQCGDTNNCSRTTYSINVMDSVKVPSSNSNYLTGNYNRTMNPCCFINLNNAHCEGEVPLSMGQQVQIYDLTPTYLFSSNLEMFGPGNVGFWFCPPQWNTNSMAIHNWYSIIIRNDECSFCRMDFHCDSVSNPEPFMILNNGGYKSGISGTRGTKNSFQGDIAIDGAGTIPPSLSVYPNPAGTEVNVKIINSGAPLVNIQIYDATGKTVFDNSYPTNNGALTSKIDLSGLSSGVYTIRIPELNYYYQLIVIR